MSVRWRLLFAWLVLWSFLFCPAASGGQGKPGILFVCSSSHELTSRRMSYLVDPKHQKELEEAGWAVGYCPLEQLTPENLQKFHVVVMAHHPARTNIWPPASKAIYEYVKAGGGLLMFADCYRFRGRLSLNKFLKPLDIEVLAERIKESDEKKIKQKIKGRDDIKAYLTEEIAPSPLTEGVRRIWYPDTYDNPCAIRCGPQWRIVLRGSKTAKSSPWQKQEKQTYQQRPPMAAYREYGQGRVVFFSTDSGLWTLDPYHFFWDGFFLDNGDGRRFLLNTYRWLSESARRNRQLGGFRKEMQKQVFDISPRLLVRPRIGAAVISRRISGTRREGIIGVKSAYSGGANTIKEFCDRAKEIGYDYLVFTEKAERITNENWDSYRKDCQDNTDENFLAIPGIAIKSRTTGNDAVVFNLRCPWPELQWRKEPSTLVQVGVSNCWYSNLAQVHPDSNPYPYYNEGALNSYAVFSYGLKNRLENDALQSYRQSVADGFQLTPIVVHDITALDGLDKAERGYRTIFYSTRWAKDFVMGHTWLHTAVVTSGPVLEEFRVHTDPPAETQLAAEGKLTVKIKVSASASIKVVRLYFRGRVVRAFYPQKKSFETEVEYYTNQSGAFHVEAEDNAAGRFYSKGVQVTWALYKHFIGGDRMNGYCYAQPPYWKGQTRKERTALKGGSLYPKLGWGDTFGYDIGWIERPNCFEIGGVAGSVRLLKASPAFIFEQATAFHWAAPHRRFVLNSTDCVIIEDDISHDQRGLEDYRRLRERSKYLKANVRITAFRPRRYTMLLVESQNEILADAKLRSGKGCNPILLNVYAGAEPSSYKEVIYINQDGREIRTSGLVHDGVRTVGSGGYVAISPNRYGIPAVYCFQPACFDTVSGKKLILRVGQKMTGNLPAGTRLDRRYLLVITRGGEDERPLLEMIRDRYGFDGTPAYRVRLTHGEVLENVYSPLLAAKDYCVRGDISQADLPEELPLRVKGLNENWDAGLFDLDKQQLIKRVAVYQGMGYTLLDVSRKRRVVIGNLLVADDPNVLITLLECRSGELHFVIHNPAAQPVDTKVRTADALTEFVPFQARYVLGAGGLKQVSVKLSARR